MVRKFSFKAVCAFLLVFTGLSSRGQHIFDTRVLDTQGRPLKVSAYTDVQGNAYLVDYWIKGTVKFESEKTVSDIPLRYDMVSGELQFQNPAGQILTFAEPVAEFLIPYPEEGVITSKPFRNGFKAADNATEATFYQILFDGSITLAKRASKVIKERRMYNSATVEKTFDLVETYYLIHDNQPLKIKRDRKMILAFAGSKKSALEAFVKSHNLDLKREADLIKLVQHYNSI